MKRALLLALAVGIVFALETFALPGCCCEPITFTGTFTPDIATCPAGYNTTFLPPTGTSCSAFCNATYGAPIVITPPPGVDCSSPTYKPAPASVSIKPVKGQKQLSLSFMLLCPAYSVNVSRCKGATCTNFANVATIAPTTVYTDTDAALRWNTTYTYKLVANYISSGWSAPTTVSGDPGDIECWYQGTDEFCVSSFYYELFNQYLMANGYGATSASSFTSNFDASVSSTFASKINRGWYCNDVNRLGVTGTDCANPQVCVADENGAQCITPSICGATTLFGLYSTAASCEALSYCFFDRSRGSVDGCFGCSPRMSCADYRTRGGCQRDHCFAGACEWHDVFPDIGIGVCVDTRVNNCPWCVRTATRGMENNESYNEVFDRCTEAKSAALAIPGKPCTFNRNTQESAGCDATACMDYSTMTCSSPPGGIALNPDNSLEAASGDPCSIKVCQVIGTGCVKNHDANAVPDCALTASDRRACELDYFPPNTTFVASTYVLGRMDWLDVRMLDKWNATADGALMQGKPGYKLRVCVVNEEESCGDASTFVETDRPKLNFNDLNLQAGRTVLATLVSGPNTLKYYSIDNRNNPEIVKEMTIYACDVCQGPKVVEVMVTPGKVINDIYYTISDIPVVTVSFNEPATLTSAMLVSGSTVIPVSATPSSGANYDYSFVPLSKLSDGMYTLTFNAKDSNGLLMDVPGTVTFVVDTTPGTVTILPPDGTVLNVTTATISFIFTEPLSLLTATLEQEVWVSKYATKNLKTDLIPLLTTSDNIIYTATVPGLTGGKKNIFVHAEDFAGNPTIGKSSFWINTGALQMRMREPSWGVSGSYTFDVIIDTTRIADCKYLYNTPTAPPANAFDFMNSFPVTTGVTHKIPNFNQIPAGDLTKHKFHVYCKLGTSTSVETFELSVDPTPPVIKSAYALPSVIVERLVPGQDIFSTTLKVQTDDDGFCKYSTQNVPFVLMDGLFSGFDEVPKKSHDGEVNVTEENVTYTYYVACQNTAEKPSATVPVTFSVDLSVPFSATSKTPPYSNTTDFLLRVETNKRSFCYVGELLVAIDTCMGECEYGYAHAHSVEASVGNHTWYVQCGTGASGESASLEIAVIVDTTPPVMTYVDDSSNLPEEPEFSYFLDRLLVKFLGKDNETPVNAYYYRVTTFFANTTVQDWTLSTNTNGTAFWVTSLNLTDGNKYRFEVYVMNVVGLRSLAKTSDGVTIDVEKMPAACQNSVKDAEESDLDCGGQCPGCLDGAVCNANIDCLSGFCNGGICAVTACDDVVKNGNETDVDCGGGACLPCASGKACVQNSDCVTGSCNYGVCGEPDGCVDGVLTGAETDIDCGGSCATKCGEGKNCQRTPDCSPGLLCIESTCSTERDSDGDTVKDDVDKCPNTPRDELADAEGCSPSQKFSCGDEISDGWRIRYFSSVLCDGDGAATADPDKDGLTNAEEYRAGTNPTEIDSDFDGWNDKIEVEAGTNPLDPSSHPPSKLRILLWLLLILLMLAALAVGGYLGYQYYLEKYAPKPPEARPAPAARPTKRRRPWPDIIERLRRIARREEPPFIDRDWMALETFAQRLKKERVVLRKDVFDRLDDLIKGKLPESKAPEVLAAIRKEPEAFKLLRRVSFEKLTPAEKAEMRKRIALLKAGKLTRAEVEELLSKLRVTAAYYHAHKAALERELADWLKR